MLHAIHQIVAGFAHGDAVSNAAVTFQEIFRSWGYHSEIFCEFSRILPELRKVTEDISTLDKVIDKDDIVLLHLSTGSQVNDEFAGLNCRKVILYHNVTPAHYFDCIQKQIANILRKGRKQVELLAGTADITMAVSQFNAQELEAMGYTDVKVLPLVINFDMLTDRKDRATLNKFSDGLKNILFVGRCAPNKKIEDLLNVFACYQKTVEPDSRLIHVGSAAGTEKYLSILKGLTKEPGINNVHFAGSVSQPELNAFYQCADAFLCMSEHEGFCIPLIESMVHDVPILAHASAAIPETMDGSGVLIHERRFDLAAEMLGRITNDKEFRSSIIEGQRQRLKRYRERNLEDELKTHLLPLVKQ